MFWQVVLTFWKEFNLDGRRLQLDKQVRVFVPSLLICIFFLLNAHGSMFVTYTRSVSVHMFFTWNSSTKHNKYVSATTNSSVRIS